MNHEIKALSIFSFHFNSAWLALSRDDRNTIRTAHIDPIFAQYQEKIAVRFLDGEAFSAQPTDIIIFEFLLEDISHYYYLMEDLRDSILYAKDYIAVDSIVLGIEDGYKIYEAIV